MNGPSTQTSETTPTSSTTDEKLSCPAAGTEKVEKVEPADPDPEPKSFVGMMKRWPKATFCIIGSEFCERFSFVGMRAVLTLYVMNIMAFSDNNATVLFHSFIVLCYTTPLFGSILADGYIGKFWTILSISLVYAAGNVILAVASTFAKGDSTHPYLDIVALVVIGIGTGGIKPCVCAFGGDQFNPNHLRMISIFFSVFYFTINAGSTISTLVTPMLRTVPCNGSDSCYPLAFGIPAGLMVLATLIFASGSVFYKKIPPKENVMARVCSTIGRAIRNKISSKTKRSHWLEHYLDTHNCESDPHCIALRNNGKLISEKCAQKRFVEDVKSLFRVIIVFLPVPFFWSLYDQQGSRWIIQAVAMNSRITGSFTVLPDQMITLNAILILIFIPIFQTFVYPAFEKCGIRTTPLRRLVAGGLLAAASFVICGLVQLGVNQTLPDVPNANTAFLSVINTYTECNITVDTPGFAPKFILSNSSLVDDKVEKRMELYRMEANGLKDVLLNISFEGACGVQQAVYTAHIEGGKSFYVIVSPQGITEGEAEWDKPTEGAGQSSMNINFMLPCSMVPPSVTWGNCHTNNDSIAYADRIVICASSRTCNPRSSTYYSWSPDEAHPQIVTHDVNSSFIATNYDFKDIRPGRYQAYYALYNTTVNGGTPAAEDIITVPIDGFAFQFDTMGGVYSFTLDARNQSSKLIPNMNIHTIVPANHLNILLQIPQYVVLSIAEVLFSITGLEFAYSQAAPTMKSVVQALWLLTVAFGDVIIIIIAQLDLFSDLAIEMFVYAIAMFVVIGVFALIAIFYYEYADFGDEAVSTATTATAPTYSTVSLADNDELLPEKKI
uniref:Oligopeptide transporter 1 n=1 Tax=Ascaris suum TaxID=6253 RepID=F1KUZ0_ASCSU